MSIHHKHHPLYFSHQMNQEVNEVFWQSALYSLAQSFIVIFEPIYLFGLGFSLIEILFFYAFVYTWYIVLAGFGAKLASHVGFKHSILLSNIAFVVYWIALFSIAQYHFLFYIAPVFFAIQKSLFWPAYDADIALAAKKDKDQEGREVGALKSVMVLAFVVGPVIGGFVSEAFGFFSLFVLASLVMLFSAYPLFRTKDLYSEHEFSFKMLLKIFSEHKQNFFAYWGYAEDLMVMSLWPVFMFIVIADVSNVGVVATIAALVSAAIMLYAGRLTDKIDKRKIVRISAIITSVLWIFRFFGRTLVGVLTFDILTKSSRSVLGIPLVTISYQHAAKKGTDYAIAYGVFYEVSLSVGKVLMALVGITILYFTGSVFLVFAFAGLMTLLYTLIK